MKFYSKVGVILLAGSTLLPGAMAAAKKAKTEAPAAPAVTADDVKALRDALAAQAAQIESLKQQMAARDAAWQQTQQQLADAKAAASAANDKAAAVETASVPKESFDKLNGELADVKTTLANNAQNALDEQKRVSGLEGTLGRFRWTGDVRVRGESFFQQGVVDRTRARIRVRFGFDGRLNDDFLAGVALATGVLTDPISTNSTLTDFFQKKTIGLDRGYVTYNPRAHKWLSLTGGKWAYSWTRTSDTFDPDLNPEGFNEKFSFDLPKQKNIKNVTFQAIQLLFNEVGGGGDSYAVGGSASSRLQFGRLTLTPSYTAMNFNRADAILNASAYQVGATTTGTTGTGAIGPLPVPGPGPGCATGNGLPNKFGPCAFGPQGVTNATYVDSKGVQHFYSGFLYSDLIIGGQIKTGTSALAARFPVNFNFEWLDNLRAVSAAPTVDSKGVLTTSPHGKQNTAYYFEASLGQNRNKGDVQVGYAFNHQEQDSAIASFTESDQRAPTNIEQHRFFALWKVAPNTSANFTYWYGHTLDTSLLNAAIAKGLKPGQTDPYLSRLQFDLVYSF